MAETRDLLLEIGTEELPSSELRDLGRSLHRSLCEAIDQRDIARGVSAGFATPRRLAVRVHGLAELQVRTGATHRGPPVSAALGQDGEPTKAALGFARKHGVSVNELEPSDDGKYLVYEEQRPDRPTATLLPEIVQDALSRLRPRKQMRWGVPGVAFSRPVHWAVLLFGEDVIETEVLGVTTGRATRGHRFHHPVSIALDRPADYDRRLYDPGHVIADFERRVEVIREQVARAAWEAGGAAELDAALVTEVASLVEWPVALAGRFDPRFLELPPEPLVAVMKDHQRYFPVRDGQGALLPSFVTVSNIDSERPEVVRGGNERVIEPRLADAEFFWQQDRRRPLAGRLDALAAMVFQRELGSLRARSGRIARLAGTLAGALDGDAQVAHRAGELSKCDLLTEMVGEFPELQGIMGGYYARHDGEPEAVARAIAEHYRPAFASDVLPETGPGQAVALADRLDALVGIFAIGQAPSGDRDPFALRRAALGVLRIAVERHLDVDLRAALEAALAGYRDGDGGGRFDDPTVVDAVEDFVLERLRAYYGALGYAADLFEAVRARRPPHPLDFDARLRALAEFRDRPEAVPLAAANKRIGNILRKSGGACVETADELLTEAAERELARQVQALAEAIAPLLERRDYGAALARLAALARPLDRFFDEVLVMADDPRLRANRIALLERARGLFLNVADLSQLQGG